MKARAFKDLDYLTDKQIQEHLERAEKYITKFEEDLKEAKDEEEIEEYKQLISMANELVEQIKKVIEYRKTKKVDA